jgi:hypothetical protein
MKAHAVVCALSIAAVCGVVGLRAQTAAAGVCQKDSKLLNAGPTQVYGDGPGTWWGLVIDGLNAAGLTSDDDKLAYLDQVFGQDFPDLAAAKDFNLTSLSDIYDANQNGYVCAFELRGTRAYSGDPLINLTTFGVSDDRLGKE